jgi:predicted AlkP superfamily pyrophosphatase or phosphodiesterase
VWDEIADMTSISQAGAISIGNQQYNVDSIAISPSPQLNEISQSIMDIAPTVANALGLPAIPNAHGKVSWKPQGSIHHAVMILLDGLQLKKLQSLIDQGDLPFFENLETVHTGLTVYPPITTSSTAALLTSTPPLENGVLGYGYRTTDLTTLFDLAIENDKSVTAVEGSSLPFNLRNTETILSGDRDGNGFSDDNVFSNSIDIIQSDLPDILYVHFHEIDDMGHEYGPNSDEYESAIIRINQYLYEIYNALPDQTFIVIFADHGMHDTSDGGNHGTLTAADLIIPIIFLEK